MTPVWDRIIRTANWLMWPALIASFFTMGGLGSAAAVHSVALSVLFVGCFLRLVWGYTGSGTALFSQMVQPLSSLVVHALHLSQLRGLSFYGHSPLGGIIAFIIFGCMVMGSLTGLFVVSADSQGTWIALAYGNLPLEGPHDLHAFFIKTAFYIGIPYALGVLWSVLSSGTSVFGFLFKGLFAVYGVPKDDEATPSDEPITAPMSALVMSVCVAVMMIVPALTGIGSQKGFDLSTRQIAQDTPPIQEPETERSISLFDENGDMNDWATILSGISTAAGDTPNPKATFGRVDTRTPYEASRQQEQNTQEQNSAADSLQNKTPDIVIELPIRTE